ncbi:hypothetical protein HHI36_011044 [Cryptolaemus montrouzieri]|uniref:HTH psq-type domain-containing protein n=1 Tax=Cryptolaemus montrouzieri TaxID=559131 RepID=A0ABD2MKP6_9CUCU
MGKPKENQKRKTPRKRGRIKKNLTDASVVKSALDELQNGGSTVYKAAKKFNIPWSTLNEYWMRRQQDPSSSSMLKRGKPFVLPSAIEIQLLNYMNKMQELSFGSTVIQIRIVAYRAYAAALDSRAIVRNAFKNAGIFPIDYNAIPDTAVAPSLVTASKDPNITEDRTVDLSHQSDEDEKEKVEPQLGPSAVTFRLFQL